MNQQGVAQAPGDFARWGFVAPADTSIASVRLQRDTAVSADPAGHWWYQSELFVGNPDQGGPVADACVGRLGCRTRGNPAVPSDPANTVAVGGLSSDQVALQVECRTDGSVAQCPGNGPTPVFYEARQAVIGLTDNVNPVFVSGPDGPLVDPTGYVRGVAGAAFEAADRGSGVYRQILRIDGHTVQSAVPDANGGLCGLPFVDPLPCKLDMTGSVSFDTTRLADGPHQVQVAVHDATDVNETASAPQTVMVDNTAPAAPLNLRVVGGDAPRPSNDFQVTSRRKCSRRPLAWRRTRCAGRCATVAWELSKRRVGAARAHDRGGSWSVLAPRGGHGPRRRASKGIPYPPPAVRRPGHVDLRRPTPPARRVRFHALNQIDAASHHAGLPRRAQVHPVRQRRPVRLADRDRRDRPGLRPVKL